MKQRGRRPNGAGGLYKRHHVWWIRYTIRLGSGRRVQIFASSRSRNLSDAQRLLAARLKVERERKGRAR